MTGTAVRWANPARSRVAPCATTGSAFDNPSGIRARIVRGIIRRVPLHMFRGRRAASIENSTLRLTVVEGGGHIVEILDKRTGVSPLWIPPWPSIEPGAFD